MRVFIAGAGGAIGRRLVPLLVEAGHQVTATTRTPNKLDALRALGANAILADGLDKDGLMRAVKAALPDAVVHQMTSLGSMRSLKKFDDEFAATNLLRTQGSAYLLEAARTAGARVFVAQSYAGWPCERSGARIKTEDDPFDPNPPKSMAKTLAAIRTLEELVTNTSGMAGVALRYGGFYGPGTSLYPGGAFAEPVRLRQMPIVGDGAGVWSFLHIDDAAHATKLAVERGIPGVFNITDDEPAEARTWIPELARLMHAKPPRHVPVWIARLVIGDAGVSMMTQIRGASNAKAKRVLSWKPTYATWRQGFAHCFSQG